MLIKSIEDLREQHRKLQVEIKSIQNEKINDPNNKISNEILNKLNELSNENHHLSKKIEFIAENSFKHDSIRLNENYFNKTNQISARDSTSDNIDPLLLSSFAQTLTQFKQTVESNTENLKLNLHFA